MRFLRKPAAVEMTVANGNLGLAYRKLLADDTVILGLNGFYDSHVDHGPSAHQSVRKR